MDQTSEKSYPSGPLENIDLEQSLGKKINDVNSFINHINNNKEKITYFKDKNHKSKKKYNNYKTPNTVLVSVDSIVIIGATTTSINPSIFGNGLFFLPISAGIAYTLSLGNKALQKLFINKYINSKNNMKKIHKLTNLLINYIASLYETI